MTSWRECFRHALDPERNWSAGRIRELLAAVDRVGPGPSRPPVPGPGAVPSEPLVAALLRDSQPMAAVLGSTLHTLTAPEVFEDEHHLRLLAVYAEDIGMGAPHRSRFDALQRVLARQRMTAVAKPRAELADLATLDEVFAVPATLLALSRRPDLVHDELVGVDLALRRTGLLGPWAWLREAGVEGEWDLLDLRRGADGFPALHERVAHIAADAGCATARLHRGGELGERLVAIWDGALWRSALRADDPHEAMIALVAARAREASVCHEGASLDGRSLQSWFVEAREDPAEMVRALARSPYVVAGDPDRSPLTSSLLRFGAPMFRVFSPEDRDVIARWVASLVPGTTHRPRVAAAARPTGRPSVDLVPFDAAADDEQDRRPGSLRECYHALRGRYCPPAVLDVAHKYVEHRLELARHGADRHPFPLPIEVPAPGMLREWLLAAHDEQARAAQRHDDDVPDREELVSETIRRAPLALIDGSWLLGFSDVSLASTRIGSVLFETYCDELGNGEPRLNHPRLYRDLLADMGVELPATGSAAFAGSALLDDADLGLPVHWLAIGRFPRTRRSEILGLNLAMELSGVGGGYRAAHRALRAHGFPTIFVDVHNTVDNVSTGHAAWAADAVEAHIDAARALGAGEADLADLWDRVRTGFASLDPHASGDFPGTVTRRAGVLRLRAGRVRRRVAAACGATAASRGRTS